MEEEYSFIKFDYVITLLAGLLVNQNAVPALLKKWPERSGTS
jgi:hypothetical protein